MAPNTQRQNFRAILDELQFLAKNVKRGLYHIIEAQAATRVCWCGRLAWGRAEPCMHLVCGRCVPDECGSCKKSPTKPNKDCKKHEFPCCPHPPCGKRPIDNFYAIAGIGQEVHGAVRREAAGVNDLLTQIDRMVDAAREA